MPGTVLILQIHILFIPSDNKVVCIESISEMNKVRFTKLSKLPSSKDNE